MKSRNTTGTRRWPSSPSPTFWQSHPGSIMQSALQPSPEVVLPSSHSSSSSLRPSPHGEAQPEVPTQTGSARQSALQPSPPKTLPSSHDSSPSRTPSPQTVGWQATPGVGQAEPGSTRHASLQPSPGMSLPSSQVSPPITMPSPQIGMQRAPIAGQIQPGSMLAVLRAAVSRRPVVVVARLRLRRPGRPRRRPSRCRASRARRRSSPSPSCSRASSRRRPSCSRRRRSPRAGPTSRFHTAERDS